MPPLPIALTVTTALPWLSPQGRAVINTVVAARGRVASANEMAIQTGLTSRFQLARLLRRDGIPPFSLLTDWLSLLQLLWEAERSSASLVELIDGLGVDPATFYRRCKRTLGVPWSEARRRGLTWALMKFLDCCHRPSRRGSPPASFIRAVNVLPLRRPNVVPPEVLPGGGSNSTRPHGELKARVALGNAPTDVAVSSDGVVYVTRAYAASVERLDLRGRTPARSIRVGCNPTRLVFDRRGRRAYVTNQFSDNISVIDVTTDRCVDEIPVEGNPAPVVVTSDDQRLFVTTNADFLYAIQVPSKRVIGALPLPATSHHLMLHPDGRRLYLATRAAGTVLEIDAATCRIARTFQVGGQTQALA